MALSLNVPAFSVEPARAEDARPVAEIHVASWREAYRGLVPQSHLDALSVDKKTELWSAVIAKVDPPLLVAREGQRVAGWLCFGPTRDEPAPPGTAEVRAFYVDPAYWSRGVGRALWLACRDQLAAQGIWQRVTLWVLASNERGLAFYRRAGFRLDEAAGMPSFELGGTVLKEVRLVYEL